MSPILHIKYFKEHLISFAQKYNPILNSSVNLSNCIGSQSSWDLQALVTLSLKGGKTGYFGGVLFPSVHSILCELRLRNTPNAAQPAVMQTRWHFSLQCCHYFINFSSDSKRMWTYPKNTHTAKREKDILANISLQRPSSYI